MSTSSSRTPNERRVLIVDDDEALRNVVSYCLRKKAYAVTETYSDQTMFETLAKSTFDVLILDVYLKEVDSLTFLARLRSQYPHMQVIMMTGSGTIDMAVEALRRGAYDFITKPVDTERLMDSVRGAVQLKRKESPLPERSTATAAAPAGSGLDGLLGNSTPMQRLKQLIVKVAASDVTLLIVGETGSGKERVATAIHSLSPRAGQPLAVVNCAALPGELIESAIFGHEKGAFTGAIQQKIGFAETANRSTLFLDEIGEMPIELQAKFLRFLENKSFHRVGGTHIITSDVRIISATNRDPQELVQQGNMREDLFYRISPVTLRVPALRERKDDIPLLARAFLRRTAAAERKEFEDFEPEALKILEEYHWPGNIRHLLNVIIEIVVIHDGKTVRVDMLPVDLLHSVRDRRGQFSGPPSPDNPSRDVRPLWQLERDAMAGAMAQCGGAVADAARLLGISPATLYRKLKQYQIDTPAG